jgi:hypothetical protein
MADIRESLCPSCGACPEVVVTDDHVRIGEAGNEVVLGREAWNALVGLIRAGRLREL